MLRDRLVCGISHKGIQRRLLQDPALTFGEAAMKVALSAEAADRDAQRLTAGTAADKDLLTEPSQGTQPPFVHKLDRPRQGRTSLSTVKQDCYRCGGKHRHATCPCRQFVCHFCKKKGHIAKMCRKRASSRAEQTNVVVDGEEDRVVQVPEYPMFHVGSGSTKQFHTTLEVNGRLLTMEVDTGASVSLISEATFKSIRQGVVTLELKESYTGEQIKVCGSTVVLFEHNDQSLQLPLLV